jgi:hypothetical protein
MTSVISKKLGYSVAQQFKEGFYEPSPTLGYVYIGNHLVYPEENNPPSITDSIADEKTVWDNMIAAKKITGTDVELVIPRVNWTANTRYKEYDDVISVSDLITGNASINVKPMYVVTTSRNVYKCLSNNASANSTVEPTGDYTTSNGNITTSDGYIWKYMYTIDENTMNEFATVDFIPVVVALFHNVPIKISLLGRSFEPLVPHNHLLELKPGMRLDGDHNFGDLFHVVVKHKEGTIVFHLLLCFLNDVH